VLMNAIQKGKGNSDSIDFIYISTIFDQDKSEF
jgi:hypothetical protein